MTRVSSAALAAAVLVSACTHGKAASTGLRETVLTPEGAHHIISQFSPDGSRVAYWATGPTGWELRVSRADLSGSRTLATAQNIFDPREGFNPILWAPDGKSIAFSSNAASFFDVWLVSPDSGAPVRLTTAPGSEFALQWHPRGDRLAYLATEEGSALRTRVITLATGKTAPLLAEQRSAVAAWSPDGSRIAYQVLEGSRSTLWVADSAGGNARQLTTEGLEVFDGTGSPWSPDGKALVYVSRRTGRGDVWVLPVDGGTPRQLTHDVRDDGAPVWSPDGTWIAFISDRGRQTDVWLVPAAGGQELRVTDDEAQETNLQWVGGARSKTLAFHTGRTSTTLSLISAADGSERQLTPDSLRITTFDLSPGGKEIAYGVTLGGGVSEVRVMPIEGGPSRTLVPGPADNGDPYWSPDGKRVLFFSNRSGSGDLWVVDAQGGQPRALTTWPTEEVDGEWSADSKSVYFLSGRGGGAFFDLYQVAATGGEPKRITSTGGVLNVEPSRGSADVFVTGLGKKAGQFVLSRMRPDGTMQVLWDKSNVEGLSHRRISPSGDSVVVQVELEGGGFRSMILSVKTGQSWPILGKDEFAGAWSPDGRQLLYYFGSPAADLGVFNLADGTTRRLTNTAASEGSTQWTPDSKSIVVLRSSPHRRIATVDIGALLGH